MDYILNYLSELMQTACQKICEIFVTVVIQAVVDFFSNIVEYFKGLKLKENIQTAFIMSTEKSAKNPLSTLIPDGLDGKGIIEGVYNNTTDDIDSLRYIGGEGVDEKTESIIKDNPIVVLK